MDVPGCLSVKAETVNDGREQMRAFGECILGVKRFRWVPVGLMMILTGSLLAWGQPVPLPGGDEAIPAVSPAARPAVTHWVGKGANVPSTEGVVPFKFSGSVKQGEVLKLILSTQDLPASEGLQLGTNDFAYATLAGRKARLFSQKNGFLQALLPVSVYEKPGVYPLSVYNAAGTLIKTLNVTIQDGRYKTQNVSVSKSTAGLQPLPGELEAIQALKDSVSPVRYWEEPFLSPTVDCQNSPFGVKRYHNGVSIGDYHKGVDLRSPAGRPIRATAAGVVKIATMYRLHGGTVGLDHGQGVGSIYIHMSKLAVKPGEMVKKGQTIGYVGSTGFASGPHLHWGLYASGLPVNPNQWVANVPKCQ